MKRLDPDEIDNKFNCPVCKKNILDYENGESGHYCSHILMIYTDLVQDEFCHVHKSVKKIAKEMVEKVIKDEQGETYLCDLMEVYANESKGECKVFSITTSGIGCGPCSSTDYVMIKMKSKK